MGSEPEAGSTEGKIARSWRLTRVAWGLVRTDRALLVLAALSGLLCVASMAWVVALVSLFQSGRFSAGHFALVALILAYPLLLVSVFLNTAIAAAAAAALEGRCLSLRQALAVPWGRIGQVAFWTLIAAGVGVLLEQVASRLPFAGSIVKRVAGVAWSLASLFVIPILALENCSAPQCLQRSALVVRDRWGESIGGSVIITAWMVVLVLPIALVIVIALVAGHDAPAVRDAVIVVDMLAFLAVIAIATVVRQTFVVALYCYATTGVVKGPFERYDLEAPFRSKRRLFR